MLRGLQEARLTGQPVRVKTSQGVETEFDPTQTNVTQVLRELEISIAGSPDYDSNDPVQLACAGNQRPAITRVNFTR